MATVKDLAAYVCDKLAGKVLIHRYDAYSTNSVYLKFDYGLGNSLRLSDHTGKAGLNYAEVPACPHFEPKTWTRPEYCHDCDRKHGEMTDGSILCDGWPEYRKEGDTACQNGKIAFGKNLSLF